MRRAWYSMTSIFALVYLTFPHEVFPKVHRFQAAAAMPRPRTEESNHQYLFLGSITTDCRPRGASLYIHGSHCDELERRLSWAVFGP